MRAKFKCLPTLALAGMLGLAIGLPAGAETMTQSSDDIEIQTLAKKLDNPWALAFLPDGRLLITEKPGNLRVYADGKLTVPIEGVPKVEYHEQGGLLDVAVDPDFAENKLVYLSYTEAAEKQPPDAKETKDPRLGDFQDLEDVTLKGLAVARGRLEGDRLQDMTVIWRQEPKTIGRGHFGGRLVFAPGNKLFITSGDRQRFEPAQDLGANLGKIVRINPDGSIPDDNPFVGQSGKRADIWTVGHRNPLGVAINPETGELWINEMGPKGGDEINIVVKGENYGWPKVSEGEHYDGTPIPSHSEGENFTMPVYAWVPAVSPAGLVFYGGDRFKDWQGKLLLAGMPEEALIVLTLNGDKVADEKRYDMGERIRDVIEAPDGSVLLLSDGDDAELWRLTPKGEARAG
jgi:glucose/arabinose dehydrogenase